MRNWVIYITIETLCDEGLNKVEKHNCNNVASFNMVIPSILTKV